LQRDLPEPAIQRTHERRRRSVRASQREKEVHHHGSDSGDEGEFPRLSPTEVEMLQFSTPLAQTDNRAQEQLDGTPEESLPDDAEDLSEDDEDTSVSEDCSLSLSATEEELRLLFGLTTESIWILANSSRCQGLDCGLEINSYILEIDFKIRNIDYLVMTRRVLGYLWKPKSVTCTMCR